MKIVTWIRDAADELANAMIPSALLDAEIILAHTLRKSRTWLHAHGDEELDSRQIDIANARINLRLDRTPIAYIIGHKEFYGRLFSVSPAVLIPRPETEMIVTLFTQLAVPQIKRVLDVGTGSGCVGITLKLEHPELDVTLSDISRHALIIAQKNATSLEADVSILRSDLLKSIPGTYDAIVANLPYVNPLWDRSPETNYEPSIALFAKNGGMELIEKLIVQASGKLSQHGLLILEADPEQHAYIIAHAAQEGFSHITTEQYIVVLKKS